MSKKNLRFRNCCIRLDYEALIKAHTFSVNVILQVLSQIYGVSVSTIKRYVYKHGQKGENSLTKGV